MGSKSMTKGREGNGSIRSERFQPPQAISSARRLRHRLWYWTNFSIQETKALPGVFAENSANSPLKIQNIAERGSYSDPCSSCCYGQRPASALNQCPAPSKRTDFRYPQPRTIGQGKDCSMLWIFTVIQQMCNLLPREDFREILILLQPGHLQVVHSSIQSYSKKEPDGYLISVDAAFTEISAHEIQSIISDILLVQCFSRLITEIEKFRTALP